MINRNRFKCFAGSVLVTVSILLMADSNQAIVTSSDLDIAKTDRLLVDDSTRTLSPGFSRYTQSERYEIEVPNDSYLNNTGSHYLIISNYAPRIGGCCFQSGDLKTDISIVEIPFEDAVSDAYIDDSGTAGQLLQVEELTIGGREAQQFWTVEGDNGADAILTLVRYSETETAYLVSFFATGDKSFTDTIQAIHGSFRSLNSHDYPQP